jgi:hypothetical protein
MGIVALLALGILGASLVMRGRGEDLLTQVLAGDDPVATTGDTTPVSQAETPQAPSMAEELNAGGGGSVATALIPPAAGFVISAIVNEVKTRKGERARFTTLFPVYTPTQQWTWIAHKYRAIKARFGRKLRTARQVRSRENSFRNEAERLPEDALVARLGENAEHPGWLRRRPSNGQVVALFEKRNGVSEDHEPIATVAAVWKRGDPVGEETA